MNLGDRCSVSCLPIGPKVKELLKLHANIDGYKRKRYFNARSRRHGYKYVGEKDGRPDSGIIIIISSSFPTTLFAIRVCTFYCLGVRRYNITFHFTFKTSLRIAIRDNTNPLIPYTRKIKNR